MPASTATIQTITAIMAGIAKAAPREEETFILPAAPCADRSGDCDRTKLGSFTIISASDFLRDFRGRNSQVITSSPASVTPKIVNPASSCRRLTASKPLRSQVQSDEHTSELQSLRHLVCRLL